MISQSGPSQPALNQVRLYEPGRTIKRGFLFLSPIMIIPPVLLLVHITIQTFSETVLDIVVEAFLLSLVIDLALVGGYFGFIREFQMDPGSFSYRKYSSKLRNRDWTDVQEITYTPGDHPRMALKLGHKNFLVFYVEGQAELERIVACWEARTGRKASTRF